MKKILRCAAAVAVALTMASCNCNLLQPAASVRHYGQLWQERDFAANCPVIYNAVGKACAAGVHDVLETFCWR